LIAKPELTDILSPERAAVRRVFPLLIKNRIFRGTL